MSEYLSLGQYLASSTPDTSHHASLISLIARMELAPSLIRRLLEEEIASQVSIDNDYISNKRSDLLGDTPLNDYLSSRNWTLDDLELSIWLPEALRRFSRSYFGPGLEELFLSSRGHHDQIIYSLLRVRDPYLAQELWIRLEEGESTFSELASCFGEGPEASKKGLMGPLPVGSIFPIELATLLRTLKAGEVSQPTSLGEWTILIRLEELKPARFDSKMEEFLLNQQLSNLLDERVELVISGQIPPSLTFDPS